MHKYVIMGVQGCGKGTQAKLLEKNYDLVHISVGEILRWNIQSHTKLAARVQRFMNDGKLVPDELVEEIIRNRLEQHDWNYGFVLEGFPRNEPQAIFFLQSYDIDAVIHIKVPDEVVYDRVMSRRLCSKCGLDYNLIQHRPAVPNTCDVCGGELVCRPDDTREALNKRLADYHTKTEPVLVLFEQKELVETVDGTQPVDDVQNEIRRKLKLKQE